MKLSNYVERFIESRDYTIHLLDNEDDHHAMCFMESDLQAISAMIDNDMFSKRVTLDQRFIMLKMIEHCRSSVLTMRYETEQSTYTTARDIYNKLAEWSFRLCE